MIKRFRKKPTGFGRSFAIISVRARGLEGNAPEASAGLSLGIEDQSLFPPAGAGPVFPAPATQRSAPHVSSDPV